MPLASGEWMEVSTIGNYKNRCSVYIPAKVVMSRSRVQLPERMHVDCECPDSLIE